MAELRRVLSYDPETGIREDFVYDQASGDITLTQSQDATPVVEAARLEHDAGDKYGRWRGDMVKVASLTMTHMLELITMGIMDRNYRIVDAKRFQRWLEDNNKFKTTPGNF